METKYRAYYKELRRSLRSMMYDNYSIMAGGINFQLPINRKVLEKVMRTLLHEERGQGDRQLSLNRARAVSPLRKRREYEN